MRSTGWLAIWDGARFLLKASNKLVPGFVVGRLVREAEDETPAGSDLEYVRERFAREGSAGLGRLRGSFALLLPDGDRLVACRDLFGLHPLFWTQVGSRLLFAAHPDRLLAEPGVSRAIDRTTLADHLRNSWSAGEETYFEAVRRVPAGEAVVFAAGGDRRAVPLVSPFGSDSIEWLAEEDFAAQFVPRLETAVARSLPVASQRAGIFLSGGLDSVSVALAAGRRDMLALSLAFPGAADESDVQTTVSARLGWPLELATIDQAVGREGLLAAALAESAQRSAPLLNLWQPAYAHLARCAVAAGCGTILTGTGGDEWLDVSPYWSADLLARGRLLRWWGFWRAACRSYPVSGRDLFFNLAWTCGLRPILGQWGRGVLPARSLQQWRRRRERRSLPVWLAPDPEVRRSLLARQERRRLVPDELGFYVTFLRATRFAGALQREFEETFESATQAGLEIAHPFWDQDLVAALFRARPESLQAGGRSKAPLRRFVAAGLPGLGIEQRPKLLAREFYTSVVSSVAAMQGQGAAFPVLSRLGIVGPYPVEREFAMHSELSSTRAMFLWALASAESWSGARTSLG